jgi:hypothetical protein
LDLRVLKISRPALFLVEAERRFSLRGPGDRALKLGPAGTIFVVRREAVPSGETLVRP